MARNASRRTGKAKSGKVKAKRAGRSKPLVAESGSVRRAPRQRTKASEPSAAGFALVDAMHRLAMANIDHAGRLAACRTPMEFWFEHMRYGQNLVAQWRSSVHSVLPRFEAR